MHSNLLVSVHFSSRAGGGIQSQTHATIPCKPTSKHIHGKTNAALPTTALTTTPSTTWTPSTSPTSPTFTTNHHSLGVAAVVTTYRPRSVFDKLWRVSWFIACNGLQPTTQNFHVIRKIVKIKRAGAEAIRKTMQTNESGCICYTENCENKESMRMSYTENGNTKKSGCRGYTEDTEYKESGRRGYTENCENY